MPKIAISCVTRWRALASRRSAFGSTTKAAKSWLAMANAIEILAVLAGGLATRMLPMTESVPKALLNVAGEPFVAHQLRLFRREGIKRVVLCLGHLGDQVVDFVGDGSRFGLKVDYSFDGDKLAGTGGAIVNALPLLGDAFFVAYGDSYLDTDYSAVGDHF